MIKLTSVFEDCFEYEGQVVNVDMAFDNILRMFELFNDEGLFDYEKIYISIHMLTDIDEEEIYSTEFEKINELFKYIMKEFVSIDLEPKEDGDGDVQKKFMDYEKDADLIYASFFAVYNMDLYKLHGELHWKKFQALLTYLDDNSPFKQVVGYRTMKVPTGRHVDKDRVAHIKKMKERYALEDDGPQQTEDVFNSLAKSFKGGGG